MSIATVIERIVGKQRERQAAGFRELVVEIADGNEPNADVVSQVLRDADQSHDDLREAVELLQRRREIRKKWDHIPDLMTQRRELERQMAEADRELETAERKHYMTVNPIGAELEQLKEATWEGEKAKQELWDTCTDPMLLGQLADVQLRLAKRREEATDLRRRIDDLRSWAKNERTEAEHQRTIIDGNGDAQAKVHITRAKEHERMAAERESMLTSINKTICTLEREESRIRKQMLVP
jgi:hypothetical protein